MNHAFAGFRLIAAAILVWISPATFSFAQSNPVVVDRVWLSPSKLTAGQTGWYPRSIEVLEGRVIDFDATNFRFLQSGRSEEMITSAERVLWLQLGEMPAAQRKIMAAFDRGDDTQMLAGLPSVLRARPPVWRQQWLTMVATVSAHRSGRSKIALELVSQLDQRPLPPLVLSWLPVDWTQSINSEVATTTARERLQDPSLATRLVASSWLLGSRDRGPATEVLTGITQQSERPTIAKLAACVLWNTSNPPHVVQQESKWLADLESLPLVLQVGPAMTLQRKFEQARRNEAAAYLDRSMKLTPVHPHSMLTVP